MAAPLGETLLEGFIDLLFEAEGDLVVIDYKTDVLETEEAVAERMAHYRVQAGAYALSVHAATGRRVREVVLLFLNAGREESFTAIEDLESLTREQVQEFLRSGV